MVVTLALLVLLLLLCLSNLKLNLMFIINKILTKQTGENKRREEEREGVGKRKIKPVTSNSSIIFFMASVSIFSVFRDRFGDMTGEAEGKEEERRGEVGEVGAVAVRVGVVGDRGVGLPQIVFFTLLKGIFIQLKVASFTLGTRGGLWGTLGDEGAEAGGGGRGGGGKQGGEGGAE